MRENNFHSFVVCVGGRGAARRRLSLAPPFFFFAVWESKRIQSFFSEIISILGNGRAPWNLITDSISESAAAILFWGSKQAPRPLGRFFFWRGAWLAIITGAAAKNIRGSLSLLLVAFAGTRGAPPSLARSILIPCMGACLADALMPADARSRRAAGAGGVNHGSRFRAPIAARDSKNNTPRRGTRHPILPRRRETAAHTFRTKHSPLSPERRIL